MGVSMNILILMIPMALFLGVGFVAAFFWANAGGQFDDLETPAHRILKDDNERNSL
jgi:cbb3-type cytochrome oxidase maturation protein